MSTERFALRFVFGLAVGLLALLAMVIVIWLKVGSDEYDSCLIQARGLKAGHALADVVGDIHTLVSAPPSPQQQEALAKAPKEIAKAYRDLNTQAGTYFRLEAQQPRTRSC